MPFERLQNLGEEKFGKILNHLVRGKPATQLARDIQQEWGEFTDVAEKTLVQQLNRLRLAAAEGMYGKQAALQIQEGHTPQIKLLAKISVQVLERLEELSDVQRQRVLDLVEKEKKMPVPVGAMLSATNAVFNDYRQVLLDLQKIRFDLGLDEYKGPIHSSTTMVRGGAVAQSFPDGTSIQKQVFEAVTTVEEIFNARKIPQVTQALP
jgi:hypothetical protein